MGSDSPASNSGTGARHAWTQPNTLRIAIQDGPNTLNPLFAGNTTEALINRLGFDPLTTTTPAGKELPVLAAQVPTSDNGGISSDGRTITYKLRHGVKWHDGEPFTSKDVAFTYAAIMNSANNVESRVGYDVVSRVETPDDFTVVFHLKRKYAPFVNTVFGDSDSPYQIVPAHILAKYPNINHTSFNDQPVGTGPFKVTRWVRGDHIEFVANDDYFLGKPKIKTITMRIIPDENTSINALRTHDVDWIFEASPGLYKTLKVMPDIHVVLSHFNQYEGLMINTARPPLDDVRVRRAIAYAVDRKSLVEKFTFGSADVANQDLPPFMWAHDKAIPPPVFDPARARAILAEAGYRPGPDGVLARNGSRLSLAISYNNANATRRGVAVQLQSMLRQVGIDAQVKTYPGSLLFAPLGMGGIWQSGKYDLGIRGWIAGVDPDNSSEFTCAARPPHGNNDMRFCDPKLDAAEEMALTHYDEPTRKKAYDTVESILSSQVPQTYFWWPHFLQPINPDFKNLDPNTVGEAWNAYQWEI